MLPIAVTCPRGLEEKLQKEIDAITHRESSMNKGHIKLTGNWSDIYKLNLYSRLASRVLLEIKKGFLASETDLYQLTHEINWSNWFSNKKTIKIKVEGKANWCKKFDFLALKIKDSICDHFMEQTNARPNIDKNNPDIRIFAYINQNQFFLYLDTSGEALFKRGWRLETDRAPIRENLAAGLLSLADYDSQTPFWDPMCGSGTLAIEAALMAAKIPPGLHRTFSFQNLLCFDQTLWNQILSNSKNDMHTPPVKIYASDVHPHTITKAIHNATRAGVENFIEFNVLSFSQIINSEPTGLLLTNPPYGQRCSEIENIRAEYPTWSKILKHQFPNWTVGFITSDLEFPKILRLTPKRKIPIFNGKIECRLYLFDIVTGSNRKKLLSIAK